jgi:hypothetical protein
VLDLNGRQDMIDEEGYQYKVELPALLHNLLVIRVVPYNIDEINNSSLHWQSPCDVIGSGATG